MLLKNYFIACITVACFITFSSCKKDNAPDPMPGPDPVKPDTLSTGWSKKVIPGDAFNDIFFNSSTTGYLIGLNIYKTTDGGNSWLAVSSNSSVYNIFMTNDNKAFFVSQGNMIIKTIDGGSSFSNKGFPTVPQDIYFTDNNTGYSIMGDGLYNTVDGGLNWVKLSTTGLPTFPGYNTLSFINNTTGWIIYPMAIYRSVGSSLNWQTAAISGGSGANFVSVFATSATNVYAANDNAEIFRSTNGGIHFSFVKKLEGTGFTDIHFLDDLNGYASVGRSVFKTTDGAVNWIKVVSLGEGILGELHFTDAGHGWVCGDKGTILTYRP